MRARVKKGFRHPAVGLGKAVAVAAMLFWSLFPIAFIVMSSLKPGKDIFAVPPKYLFTPTFEHYVSLLEEQPDRLMLEQTHLFAAMDHAGRTGQLARMLRIERLLAALEAYEAGEL